MGGGGETGFMYVTSFFILGNRYLNNRVSIYANPVFWVPVSWGKVFGVLRPLPNH